MNKAVSLSFKWCPDSVTDRFQVCHVSGCGFTT